MRQESIIAQVDESTKQLMEEISGDITEAIGNTLQDIKDDTKAIEDIIEQTESITSKLSHFDGLSSSLAELQGFAKESQLLAERISPLESRLEDLGKNISHEFEQSKNKTCEVVSGIESLHSVMDAEKDAVTDIANTVSNIHSVISSVVETQSRKFTEVSEVLRNAEEKNLAFNDSALRSLTECQNDIQSANDKLATVLDKVNSQTDDISQFITTNSESIVNAIKNENESINQRVADMSRKMQEVNTYVHQNVNELNSRIESLQTMLQNSIQQNESQLNVLKESVDKVQVTLDIVVNLTTPFWKKWCK